MLWPPELRSTRWELEDVASGYFEAHFEGRGCCDGGQSPEWLLLDVFYTRLLDGCHGSLMKACDFPNGLFESSVVLRIALKALFVTEALLV